MMNKDSAKAGKLWTKDFVLASLSNLFLFFSYHMLTPTIPAYVLERNGDKLQAGMAVGVYMVTAVLVRPLAGRALDKWGRKKILLLGIAVFTATVFGYPLMLSAGLILFLRAVQGVGWGISTTGLGTVVSDLIVPNRRAEGMGFFGLSINLAMALAPFIGIWLMERHGFTVLFCSAALPVLLIFPLLRFIRFPPFPAKNVPAEKGALIEKSALFPSLLVMLTTLAHGGILSTITLFGQEAGIANVGWFFLAHSAVVLFIRPVSGRIFDRKGHVFVLLPGAVFLGTGLYLLSCSTGTWSLILSAFFYGFGFGSVLPALQAWIINRASPWHRGAANGMFYSAFDLGVGAGAMLLGFIAKWTGYAAVYQISVLFIAAYGLAYGLYLWLENGRRARTAKNEKF